MKLFGNTDSRMIAFLVTNLESYLGTIKTDLGLTAEPSEELKGFLILVASYLSKAGRSYQGKAYPSAKIIAPVMSRTALHKPFTKLTTEEQTALKANNGEPLAKILWYIITYMSSRTANANPWGKWKTRYVYQRCSTDDITPNPDPHGYIIPKGQKGNEDGKMGPAAGPLVMEFIKGLTENKDLMQIQTMGKYDKFEDVGGVDGYILEFRRMPSLPHTQWKDAFVAAYTFLSAVNLASTPTDAVSVSDVTFGFLERSNEMDQKVPRGRPQLIDQTAPRKAKQKLAARMKAKL